MLDKLKKIFPSLIPYNEHLNADYHWFISENNDIFGIHKEELSKKDMALLSAFFRNYDMSLPLQSPTEKMWQKRIDGKSDTIPRHPFRFIYFRLPYSQITPGEFADAFHTLFEEKYPILWENDAEGILIEEIPQTKEAIEFEQIIDILMNDLAVNVHFFIGPLKQDDKQLKQTYQRVLRFGKELLSLTDQYVLHYTESFPYLLLKQLPEAERKEMGKSILEPFDNDRDMLETLENYFFYNLNISETAKNMYMHRNSIQYRIDKFIKETNINIQSFNEAVTVKLALLAKSF